MGIALVLEIILILVVAGLLTLVWGPGVIGLRGRKHIAATTASFIVLLLLFPPWLVLERESIGKDHREYSDWKPHIAHRSLLSPRPHAASVEQHVFGPVLAAEFAVALTTGLLLAKMTKARPKQEPNKDE